MKDSEQYEIGVLDLVGTACVHMGCRFGTARTIVLFEWHPGLFYRSLNRYHNEEALSAAREYNSHSDRLGHRDPLLSVVNVQCSMANSG